MISLEGFTSDTYDFIAEEIEGIWGMSFDPGECLTPSNAAYLFFRLRATPDDYFPGGKWATIQHLETLIDDFFREASAG